MVILVTGGAGQLGEAIQSISHHFTDLRFLFYSSSQADVTDLESLKAVFHHLKPAYCINAAAYTAVDKAEQEPDKAFAVNVLGAENIANACKEFGTVLIHVSTDFVFDGKQSEPYAETDISNPINIYGQTKREGELKIECILDTYFIIRTSWLYSNFGNNFMKTMLKLADSRNAIKVVNDQFGAPTHACDFAKVLIEIIRSKNVGYGIYHFSNSGKASWYDFAREIFKLKEIDIALVPISTNNYPTAAKRPKYSVLNTMKIELAFGLRIISWRDALHEYNNIG